MIDIVFCDIGGVLLEIDPELTINFWADASGASPDHIRNAFPLEIHHDYEKGRLTDREFYRIIAESLKPHQLSEKDFWRGWRNLVGAETGLWNLLRVFPKNQIPVWLLSNTNPRHIVGGLKNEIDFFREVNGSIYSYEVNCRKPEPEIFKLALEKAGVQAHRALFIDDMEPNIRQARQLGFQTIHYTNLEDTRQALAGYHYFDD